jgi:hypothetical protein
MSGPTQAKPAALRTKSGAYVAILLVCVAGVVGVLVVVSTSGPSPPMPTGATFQTCPGNATIEINGTNYWTCNVTLNWAGVRLFNTTPHIHAALHGVAFDVYGYPTMECPVVAVTGNETGGASFSLYIAPSPVNCTLMEPTVVSPDHDFGATWNWGASVELLVRAWVSWTIQTCPGNTTIEFNGTTYWTCNVTLNWTGVRLFNTTPHIHATLHGVAFDVYAYDTMECTVVNVTGNESGGASFSFLIYPLSRLPNCTFTELTVLSPDREFGATWYAGPLGDSGTAVQLLVRVT